MSKELEDYGVYIGRDKIRSCYSILGLAAIYPKPNLSKNDPDHKIYPYLLRNATINMVNQVWSADITYIRLTKGFVYLVAIIDWYSRYILSWRLSNSLHHEFCMNALDEALTMYAKPEIFNTDQGSQFTSSNWTNMLIKNDVKISMDGRGRALDNVFIERFWRSLKQEKIYLLELQSIMEAKAAINEYMIFYNNMRKHQSLNYRAPFEIYSAK
jgi:putative transposase